MKEALYESIGHGNLRWKELKELLLDVETTVNNRPLPYAVLTPNSMQFGQFSTIPEEEAAELENVDLPKRGKYLRSYKDVIWSRWTSEYI